VEIFLLILLVLASAFFSGSETAFIYLDKIKIRQIEEIKSSSARRVIDLLRDPYKLLVTILVGNTIVNIAASSIMSEVFYSFLGEKGVFLSVFVMTIILLILGEVTPKMFALSHPVKVSFFSSLILKLTEILFTPIRLLLVKISGKIVKFFGFKEHPEKHTITEQEIRSLFMLGSEEGVVKEKEKDMLEGVLELKQRNAADIMTPRIDIMALDMTLPREELAVRIKESQFSRFPVFIHTLDNIVGIIHTKEILLNEAKNVGDMVEKPFFAPESMRIADLLPELQKSNMHMAIVTDEYGVTSGVVTIEDILEEIVGEIRDEFDFEAPNIKKIDKKTFEINGQTHIDEVNEGLALDILTDEVDTIGGYITLLIGKMPQAGDNVKIGDYLFAVNDVSKNRITTLNVSRTEE
jgi:putative hemolysin